MTRPPPWRSLAAALALATVARAPAANAQGLSDPTRSACIAASEAGQVSRQSGSLRAARTSFLACSKADCPQTVRLDCTGWLEELDKTIPTVVVRALDGHGAEVVDAKVWFDHELIEEHLLGSAVSVDPGEHVFTVRLESGQYVDQRVVVHEGEKARSVLVQFPPAAGPAAPAPAVVVTEAQPTATTANVVAGSILAAVAAGALATGVYFETQEASEASTLRGECPHGCVSTPTLASQVSSGKTDETMEAVTFSVSGAALAAALYFFIGKPLRASPTTPRTGAFELAPSRGGAAARWTLRF